MKYATKYKETKYKDGIQTSISEYKFIEDITDDDILFLEDTFGIDATGDFESSYNNGIIYNWEDLYYIDVDKVIDTIHQYIEQSQDEGEDEEDWPYVKTLKELLPRLEKYEGYDIYSEYVPDALKEEKK
ncbi:MAG: hypothetical protein ACOCP8_01035 [archaeon]